MTLLAPQCNLARQRERRKEEMWELAITQTALWKNKYESRMQRIFENLVSTDIYLSIWLALR